MVEKEAVLQRNTEKFQCQGKHAQDFSPYMRVELQKYEIGDISFAQSGKGKKTTKDEFLERINILSH